MPEIDWIGIITATIASGLGLCFFALLASTIADGSEQEDCRDEED